MAQARLRIGSLSLLAAACVSGGIAQAEPAPNRPHLISGSGTSDSGRFKASASGAVFEMPNGAKFRVAPNTILRVSPVSQDLQLTSGPPAKTWSFSLMSGRVDVEMPSSKHNAVLASLGKLGALVTAGHVTLLVTASETIVANPEGEVRTMLADRWQTVKVGSVVMLSRDNPSAAAKAGIPFPALNAGQRMFVAPNDALAMRGFSWAAVPGATRYELRLRRSADGKVVDRRSATGTEFNDPLAPVLPGNYGLSLRSVDARGLESNWSPEAELRVVGVVLPPGGYSDDRAIYVGAGQQVKFTNTSGLEMTYLGASGYFPATTAVTLYKDHTTIVGFRLPGAPNTATARLEPRNVYADVHIGPQRASWPRDTVSIDIQLKSKSGAEIPSFLRVVPQVTLGLAPIDVTFERHGNVLHAVVPPSRGTGPWVLRVEVADQFGVALGRDFLEVASQPSEKPAAPQIANEIKNAPASSKVKRAPAAGGKVASSN